MDCSGEDGRSLPSMWAKRNDRLEYLDICASPPSDGFFHASQHRMNRQQQTAIGGCVKEIESQKTDMGQNITKFKTDDTINADDQISCFNSGTSGLFKSFAPAYKSATGDGDLSDGSVGSVGQGKVLNMNHTELEKWASKNIRGSSESSAVVTATDDSALTPIDHLVSRRRNPVITKTEEGGSMRLVEKLGTPDVTPCTTPAVTPACSPQVPRKFGNPFFTGDANKKEDGSWLFRPGSKDASDSISYEAKVEIQAQASSQSVKKTVRYVPRPSQLRELNFWSPTSM